MGSWRNRPRRRYCHPQDPPPSPPRPLHSEPSPPRSWQDGIPSWEKKFCIRIGSMPWRKVVRAKNVMYCHGNILNWDDSAGEEAFQNAKKRFWADINGLPRDVSIPDPDIYIGEIDWNPNIDPDLIKDLDRAFFAPDEGQKIDEVGGKNKKSKIFASVPSEECNVIPENVDNPWECDHILARESLKDKIQSQWDKNVDESRNLESENNPWCSGDGGSKSNIWDNSRDMPGWNQGVKPFIGRSTGWGDSGTDNWGLNHRESTNMDNGNNASQHHNYNYGAPKNEGWNGNRGSSWGWKQREETNLEHKRNHGGWGASNEGFRRETFHQSTSGYRNSRFQSNGYQNGQSSRFQSNGYQSGRSSRFQGNGYQTGPSWRNGKKRGNFAF